MASSFKLPIINKKTLKELNEQLAKLQMLYDECEKAESVGIGGLDDVKQNCVDLRDKIVRFKATYFSKEL